jgi:hypothetical protein
MVTEIAAKAIVRYDLKFRIALATISVATYNFAFAAS